MLTTLSLRAYRSLFLSALSLAVVGLCQPQATAQNLKITVENLSPSTGFFLTPVWYGLHDGSFDLFDIGGAATPGLELLAEDGGTGTLEAEFAAPSRLQGVVANPAGFGGAPLIDTGETATAIQQTFNPSAYRYFSFASMVIPSNDAFIGNESGTAYELFDAAGNFNGELTIDIFGADIWDAGTEVNDTFGAAFSGVGGVGTTEGGTVQSHLGLSNFEGTATPVGLIGSGLAPGSATPVARITISQVPEPTTAVMGVIALVGMGLAGRKRS